MMANTRDAHKQGRLRFMIIPTRLSCDLDADSNKHCHSHISARLLSSCEINNNTMAARHPLPGAFSHRGQVLNFFSR